MAQQPSEVDPAQQALESLASYLRLRALYPAKNLRVGAARDLLLDWTWQSAVGGRTVRIRISPERAHVDEVPVEISTPNLRWFAEQILKVSIGGFDLTAAVDADALERLATSLQRSASRNPTPLLDSWPSDETRIRPIPLVFAGSHSGESRDTATDSESAAVDTATRAELVKRIHSDPQLRLRLDALQARLDEQAGEGEVRRELPVIDRILELVQGDAGAADHDPITVVDRALATIDREILSKIESIDGAGTSALAETSLRVAHRFFSPQTAVVVADGDESSVTERPEDRMVVDDLDGLIVDLLGLPWGNAAPAFDEETRQDEHYLGILCELLETHLISTTPSRAAAAIGRLALSRDGLDLARLREIFRSPTGARSAPAAAAGDLAVETIRAFHAAGALDVLLKEGLVEPEIFGTEFPNWFGEWVDTLSPGRAQDEDLFARALMSIPPGKFDEGFGHLFASDVLPGTDRLTRVMELAGARAGALLVRLLQFHPGVMRGFALRWLFKSSLPPTESAAIRLLPADRIPIDHIGHLCLLADGDDRQRSRVLEESGALLRRFAVEGTEAIHHDRRIRVIRSLADFPNLQTRGVLEDLASGWGIASAERRELRSVAKETLRVVRNRPCA
ncbi:MAG: hypothetical protein AB7I19_09720 [Planctomycetota bacterium]